jgi:hypothetical protein
MPYCLACLSVTSLGLWTVSVLTLRCNTLLKLYDKVCMFAKWEVVTSVLLNIQVFRDVTLCHWDFSSWRFKGYCLLEYMTGEDNMILRNFVWTVTPAQRNIPEDFHSAHVSFSDGFGYMGLRRTYRHSPTYPIVTFQKIREKSNFAQVGI